MRPFVWQYDIREELRMIAEFRKNQERLASVPVREISGYVRDITGTYHLPFW